MVLDHKAKFRISVLSALRVSVVSLSLAGIHHGGTEDTEATHPPLLVFAIMTKQCRVFVKTCPCNLCNLCFEGAGYETETVLTGRDGSRD